MWTLSDFRQRAGLLVVLAGLFGFLGAWAVSAQTGAEAPSGDPALRQAVESRYEVLPIRGGILLKPRTERLGVRTIELSGDAIAVNGEKVAPNVLRAWLAEESEPILRLHGLEPAERRSLFGIAIDGTAPPATTELAEPEEIEAPEAPAPPEPTDEINEIPAAPEEPAAQEEPAVRSGSQVRFGSGVTVEENELAEEVVAIGGPVRIDGEVSQDVAAIGGPVRINGRVGGDVAAIGGKVHLGANAEVMGDVAAVGGSIEREPGAKIHGSSSEVPGFLPGFGGGHGWDGDVEVWPFFVSPFGATMELFWALMWVVLLGLLVCLALLLARRSVDRADAQLVAEPWLCALVGFLAVIFFFPLLAVVTVLLAITIVGCVLFLLYPFLFLGVGLVVLLGYATVSYRLGRWVEFRFGWAPGSPYRAALIGFALLNGWALLGRLFALGGSFLDMFAVATLLFAALVQVSAVAVGVGSVLLAWFQGRSRRSFGTTPAPLVSPAAASQPPIPQTYEAPPVPPAAPSPAAPDPDLEPPAFPETWEDPRDGR